MNGVRGLEDNSKITLSHARSALVELRYLYETFMTDHAVKVD